MVCGRIVKEIVPNKLYKLPLTASAIDKIFSFLVWRQIFFGVVSS